MHRRNTPDRTRWKRLGVFRTPSKDYVIYAEPLAICRSSEDSNEAKRRIAALIRECTGDMPTKGQLEYTHKGHWACWKSILATAGAVRAEAGTEFVPATA